MERRPLPGPLGRQTPRLARVELDEIFPFSPAFKASYDRLKAAGGGGTSAIASGQEIGAARFYLESVEAIVAFHPEDEVRRLRDCPLLMVHGAADDVAPLETAEAVYANAPGTKRLVVIPEAGHNQLDTDPGLADAAELAADWFARHLQKR